MRCRSCSASLEQVLIDLGSAPLSNAYLTESDLLGPEVWFPLRVFVCDTCWLVQAEVFSEATDIFTDKYAYFSSYSETWLQHAWEFQRQITKDLDLNSNSFVIEVASNDGYLLQYFAREAIPCLGIEPTSSTAQTARSQGIPTLQVFFDSNVARDVLDKYGTADLIVCNNVIAHVPDPLDFLRGIALLLDVDGIATFEFPHLLNLLALHQFDTIYHEHFCYFSLTAIKGLLERSGLQLIRVQEIPTHGGSLRIYVSTESGDRSSVESSVQHVISREEEAGLNSQNAYKGLQRLADQAKDELVTFLINAKKQGKAVVGYGAAAKGNTLLNYAGIRQDLLPFVVDRNPNKVGKFMPGSRIPILHEELLMRERPDYILILPWNLASEIEEQLAYTRDWSARFVRAIPRIDVR